MSNTKIKLVDENRGVAREFDSWGEAEREKKRLSGLSSYRIEERHACDSCNSEFDSERDRDEHELECRGTRQEPEMGGSA